MLWHSLEAFWVLGFSSFILGGVLVLWGTFWVLAIALIRWELFWYFSILTLQKCLNILESVLEVYLDSEECLV